MCENFQGNGQILKVPRSLFKAGRRAVVLRPCPAQRDLRLGGVMAAIVTLVSSHGVFPKNFRCESPNET